MKLARELAAQLSTSIFDRIERDRTLIKQNIEDAICDGLILAYAKEQQSASAPPNADYHQILDAAAYLVRLIQSDLSLARNTPYPVCRAIDAIHQALVSIGWRP